MTTTGYKLTDGRYFIITSKSGKVVKIQQPLFGCGIYPAPIKDVPEKEWPEMFFLVAFPHYKKELFGVHKKGVSDRHNSYLTPATLPLVEKGIYTKIVT